MSEPVTLMRPPPRADSDPGRAARPVTSPAGRAAGRADVGDTGTAERLHAEYLDAVYRYVARRVARAQEAEDVTAEVFVAAVTAWPRYRGDATPYVYLLGIARRKLIDHRRRRWWRELLAADFTPRAGDTGGTSAAALAEALEEADPGPEQAALRGERRHAIRELVAGLKEEPREALLLRYVEGLSVAEVAAVIGRSPAATNSLLQRTRQILHRRGRAYFLDHDLDDNGTPQAGDTSDSPEANDERNA